VKEIAMGILAISGPVLAFGLPLLLFVGSAFLGIAVKRNLPNIIGCLVLIVCTAALVVPSAIAESWPAPWWMAAGYGPFVYKPEFFLGIAAISVSSFVIFLTIGSAWARRHRS
jgi:hypothetical protein